MSSPSPPPSASTPPPSSVPPTDAAVAGASTPPPTRDRIPRIVLRVQAWLYGWLPSESRRLLAIVIIVLAVFAAFVLASSRLLLVIVEWLDIAALLGLFLVNWVGNGGALVPIPGARFLGLLLIFQQSIILASWEVLVTAGAAMGLGLLSYYVAGARTAQSYADGDDAAAQELAHQTGMLDDDALDFAPGSRLDAEAVAAISGVHSPSPDVVEGKTEPAAVPAGRTDRIRHRFSHSVRQARERAQPIIEQRGTVGLFLLCFPPTPLSTAAAYVGGLIGFGFVRFMLAAFSAKFLLAGIIVVLGLTFSSAAAAVTVPEIHIPIVDITLFDDGDPSGG